MEDLQEPKDLSDVVQVAYEVSTSLTIKEGIVERKYLVGLPNVVRKSDGNRALNFDDYRTFGSLPELADAIVNNYIYLDRNLNLRKYNDSMRQSLDLFIYGSGGAQSGHAEMLFENGDPSAMQCYVPLEPAEFTTLLVEVHQRLDAYQKTRNQTE